MPQRMPGDVAHAGVVTNLSPVARQLSRRLRAAVECREDQRVIQ